MALKRKQEELARLTNEINMFESEKVTRELILLNAHEIDTKLGEIAKLTTKYYNENSKKQFPMETSLSLFLQRQKQSRTQILICDYERQF